MTLSDQSESRLKPSERAALDTIRKLRAENERLREALRRIAAGHPDGGPWTNGAQQIAKAAIELAFDEDRA